MKLFKVNYWNNSNDDPISLFNFDRFFRKKLNKTSSETIKYSYFALFVYILVKIAIFAWIIAFCWYCHTIDCASYIVIFCLKSKISYFSLFVNEKSALTQWFHFFPPKWSTNTNIQIKNKSTNIIKKMSIWYHIAMPQYSQNICTKFVFPQNLKNSLEIPVFSLFWYYYSLSSESWNFPKIFFKVEM